MSGNGAPFLDDAARREHLLEELEHRKRSERDAAASRRRQRNGHAVSTAACGISRQVTDLAATIGVGSATGSATGGATGSTTGTRAGGTVAAYVSRRDEPGTLTAIEVLHAAGVEVLLPVLGPSLDRGWGVFTSLEDLAHRAPGRPLEPLVGVSDATALTRASLILVPALAVDRDGIRLGRGGGWYDRALLHAAPDATVVAVVYDDEVRDSPLPRAEHDVAVSGVLTPTRWWLLGAAAS